MAMTVENAQKELERINKELESYAVLIERRKMLEQFVALANQLSGSRNNSKPRAISPKPKGEAMTTPEFARSVLERSNPLHLREIIRTMRENGGKGSDNAANAEKTVYVGMMRHPEWFIKVGPNIWSVKRQEKAAS
jgi:hypothetical protein